MSSAPQHDVADLILVDFYILVESVDFVMVCHCFVLEFGLEMVWHAFGFGFSFLQVGLSGFVGHPGQGGQFFYSFDEVNAEVVVVDGRLSVLVSL